jgi:hypothetical protein
MWWGIGGVGLLLYFLILIFFGFRTLRKGHWIMFLVGIFIPLFWLIGALIPSTRPQTA